MIRDDNFDNFQPAGELFLYQTEEATCKFYLQVCSVCGKSVALEINHYNASLKRGTTP